MMKKLAITLLVFSLLLCGVVSADGTGGVITYDGDFTIHSFYENGTFGNIGAQLINVSILVIAGGGGGCSRHGGGGGAGGLIYDGSFTITSLDYTVIIGEGGIGAQNEEPSEPCYSGENSSFGDLLDANGGGHGGSDETITAVAGGSGGGGGGYTNTAGGAATPPGQGNAGGNGGGVYYGGGGGGAGGVGESYTSGLTAGGSGSVYSINGSSVTYAGGGGGGGWAEGNQGDNGTANTGDGGGGSGSGGTPALKGGYGGSGIIIIRYLTSLKLPPTSNISLLFKNTTNDYKTVFDEGENLYGIINWTNSTGSPLSDSVGSCNMTFVDGIEETEGTNEDVNFCTDPSCDFETLTETFTFSTNNSEQTINEDLMIIKDVCKYGGTKDLELDVTCNGASGSFDITNAEMPLCPNTIQIIKDIGNLCVNSTTINVTISTIEVPYTSRKEYHEIEIDREYALLLLVDGIGITYNSTSGLWESNVTTEYYIHGSKQAFANCSHFTNSSMNNSVTQNITIVNAPPEVIFSGVQTSLGLTNASDPMTIEYASGIWSWMGSVSDDDLDHFNVSIYNSSGGLIINWTGLINNTVLETPDGMFVDWDVGNPYSLNVTAIDSVGNFTIISVNFFVNDTINPSCDFANDSQLQNTDYSFDVVCTDEFFFNLNVTCDNNFSFFRDNLNTTSYNFINQTLIGTSDVTCTARYCDAHTGELSTDWVVDVKDKKFTFKTNTLEIDTPSTLSYEILADRVKFTFEMPKTLLPNLLTKWKYTYTFTYVTEGKSYYLVNDQYEAHIVDSTSETWFDLNGIEGDITVKRLSDNTWEVKVMTDQLKLEFESVGELNCVETEFVISSSLAIITCQYDSTPFMKTNLILGNRNFIPVLCQITGGEGQVFSCTTKVMNGIYLLQANPEPLSYELLGGNNFGVFKAQPLNGASQNLLAYYTEKGLRSNKTAQIHVNCVSGSTLINFNATITPQYKDLYGVMDVAVKVQQNVVWQVAYVVGIIVVVFFVILFMGMGISFIKKELRR